MPDKRKETEIARLRRHNAKLRAAVLDVLQHGYLPIERIWKILAKAERATR